MDPFDEGDPFELVELCGKRAGVDLTREEAVQV